MPKHNDQNPNMMTREEFAKYSKRIAASKVVDGIIEDLSDRRGLRQAFESIDSEIQDEIRDSWIEIVLKGMS
jgi:hypothetical protein